MPTVINSWRVPFYAWIEPEPIEDDRPKPEPIRYIEYRNEMVTLHGRPAGQTVARESWTGKETIIEGPAYL